jgi:hypothetical protein
MPYYLDKFEHYDITAVNTSLNDDSTNAIVSYAQGIHNATEALKKLYDFIQTYNEPTILIFIGDHLPFIYSNVSNDLLMDMEYFNTSNELLNLYRKYNTECLIFNNYNDNLDYLPNSIGPDGILTKIINNINIKSNNLYKWLDTTFEILPSYNRYLYQTKNDLSKYENLTTEETAIYRIKQQMHYYMLFDNK